MCCKNAEQWCKGMLQTSKILWCQLIRSWHFWNEKHFHGVGREGVLLLRKTYQPIAVVNGNRGPGDVCDVTGKGAVCLEQLTAQYPLRAIGGFSLVGAHARIVASTAVSESRDLVVPLHHRARRHQPAVRPQTKVKLLSKGSDVEEKPLFSFTVFKHLPLNTLLVSGGEQVWQVVSVGVGAEGGDQAVFFQPALQLLCETTQEASKVSFSKKQ